LKKFIVIYYAPESATKQMEGVSPEEMKKRMKPWMDWQEKIGDGLVDMGTPLVNGQKVSKSGSTPSDKEVAGYSILQAESMDKAVDMLKEHPHLEMGEGLDVEVYESHTLPGMK